MGDGKPIRISPGEKLVVGSDGRPYIQRVDGTVIDGYTGRQLTDALGNPLIIPYGGKLSMGDGGAIVERPDGTLVGQDGKILLGPDGKPLRRAPGERIVFGDDGRVYKVGRDGMVQDAQTGRTL